MHDAKDLSRIIEAAAMLGRGGYVEISYGSFYMKVVQGDGQPVIEADLGTRYRIGEDYSVVEADRTRRFLK